MSRHFLSTMAAVVGIATLAAQGGMAFAAVTPSEAQAVVQAEAGASRLHLAASHGGSSSGSGSSHGFRGTYHGENRPNFGYDVAPFGDYDMFNDQCNMPGYDPNCHTYGY
jgi:hypothetical protein